MAAEHKSDRKASPASKRKRPAPLGRYLRKFALQNVRTFRSPVTLDFCHADGRAAQWTVILGENGTGKTTLLQYLAGMMPMDEHTSESTHPENSYFGPVLASPSREAWHSANLPRSRHGDIGPVASLDVFAPLSSLALADNSKADKRGVINLEFIFHVETDTTKFLSCGTWTQRQDGYPECFRLYAYGASRHVAGAGSPYVSSDAFFKNGNNEPTSTLYHDDYPLISPEQWFLGLDHVSRSEGITAAAAKRAFSSASRCFIRTLPNIAGIAVKPCKDVNGQTAMTLMCQTPYGEVPFSALSIGYRTMAAWLTDFVKRMHEAFPDLAEPDNGPAIVLIDEFDLHMHPKWQRQAMAALSKEFPNTQFIVTAHSPLIVQATEGNAKLIVLRRIQHEDGTEEMLVDDNPRYAAGWRIDQILSSDLYDLDPRSPRYDALMEENIRLRQKEHRTMEEAKHLTEIEGELEREAPPGTSSASRQLFKDLEQALQEAQGKRKWVVFTPLLIA